ncbi:MAG: RNA-directed DNA polymerase [Elusimicrobia bacterium]|nr:RNA-directed DNA polymerase [Elusimicrobiota bacterium]
MIDFITRITSADNLYWAWNKALRMFLYGDSWVDLRELARFEGNLNFELESIANDIRNNKYCITPLRPILYPKKIKEQQEPELRQWFYISVRDQVAWIAFVNIVGPFLDYKMPPWSYSYRLYRPVWYETKDADDKDDLKVGWYRNTSGHLYRKFNQSWPLYRRQVYLTSRQMTKPKYHKYIELNESDKRILEREEQLTDPRMKLQYLMADYWDKKADRVYWAGLDLKRFYPSVSLSSVEENIEKYLGVKQNPKIGDLVKSLLTFPIDLTGFTKNELNLIFIDKERLLLNYSLNRGQLYGLPTGLFVSGFLSNIAMMGIDSEVEKNAKKNQVAHFRYVDDHTILAPSFEKLVEWIDYYKKLLMQYQPNVVINDEKYEPEKLKNYIINRDSAMSDETKKLENEARDQSCLDPKFPTPLMTKTLALVSAINDVEFELLDEKEQEQLLENLEHLLLVNIPGHELRVDTRISFAASKIARLAPIRFPHYSATEIYELTHRIQQKEQEKESLDESKKGLKRNSKKMSEITKLINTIEKELIDLRKRESALLKKNTDEERKEKKRTFALLLKTLEDYPEKIRVWSRLIEFCRNTGFSEIDPIFDKLNQIKEKNIESYYFYRSHILETIAKQFCSCVRNITDKSLLTQHRNASIDFILGLLNSPGLHALYSEKNGKYYEVVSKQIFECTLGIVVLVLKDINQNTFPKQNNIKIICDRAKIFNYLDFDKCEDWIGKESEYDLSIWAWFAEQKVAFSVQHSPTVVWYKVMNKLKLKSLLTWPLLKKYPNNLSDVNRFYKSLTDRNAHFLETNDEGLLYEYVRNMSAAKIEKLSKYNLPYLEHIFPNLTGQRKGYVNLYEWIDFLNNLKLNNQLFDPRLSEWTAINLTRKVCSLYTKSIPNMEKRWNINPANYWIPAEWINFKEMNLSWEKWKEMMKSEIQLSKNPILDVRYTPIFTNTEKDNKEFSPILGLGLVLLGLVLHNYKLPAAWNPKGHRRAWEHIVRRLLQETACSSWTEIVIESCLLPRVRENLSIKTWQKELFTNYTPDDMNDDPPIIASIDDLEKELEITMKKLEKHQVSVQENLPRQLTPVRISQLKKNILIAENEEE